MHSKRPTPILIGPAVAATKLLWHEETVVDCLVLQLKATSSGFLRVAISFSTRVNPVVVIDNIIDVRFPAVLVLFEGNREGNRHGLESSW